MLTDKNIRLFCDTLFQIMSLSANSFTKSELITDDKIGASFEALILTFVLSRKTLEKNFYNQFPIIRNRQISDIERYATNNSLINRIKPNFREFIDDRSELYFYDIEQHENDNKWLMVQSVHAIYFEPLRENITIENCFHNKSMDSGSLKSLMWFHSTFKSVAYSLPSFIIELGNGLQ